MTSRMSARGLTQPVDAMAQTLESTRLIDRLAMAHDASHYLLVPQKVVRASDTTHVADIMAAAFRDGTSVTFRSGGTSLSGQAASNSVLVDTRRNFRRVTVLDGGLRVRCQPGATVRNVNAHLARYGRQVGPDPASEIACTIGGVVANNSSGMSCGTQFNTYRTLESLVVVLPDGTVVDTAWPDADDRLHRQRPDLWEGLAALRDRVRANPDSLARIASQYAMKNTMGYGVNSFVDFDEPVHILEHLIIGSEGTLGFVAEATFRTIPVLAHTATALWVVDDLTQATDVLPSLIAGGATALELLDAASLRVVQQYPEAPGALRALDVHGHAALLIEASADHTDELDERIGVLRDALGPVDLANSVGFTTDAAVRDDLWHLRKGLYATVAAARPVGSTNLLEDIAVPVDRLTPTTEGLHELFVRHGYPQAVIFGHARDGNIHFMITPHLDRPDGLDAYAGFTDGMVDLVLGQGGTLKAEHGTGRVMAPFVERQFGTELYQVMRQVKQLVDPAGVLNPGTLLTDDPKLHLHDLKVTPPVDGFIDRCVDCGYCEPGCPSRDLTTTPRQRIALLRSEQLLDAEQAAQVRRDYAYAAVDTCAVDSLCVTACPVHIDTGVFMKRFRAARHRDVLQQGAELLADHWSGAVRGLRAVLTAADALPTPVLSEVTSAARAVLPRDWIPQVGDDLPGAGPQRPAPHYPASPDAVFFSSCMNSLFAPSERSHDRGVIDALTHVAESAGLNLLVPDGLAELCCGMVWVSKGLTTGADAMARRTFDVLWQASEQGRLPVVCDAASCSHTLLELADHLPPEQAQQWQQITVMDATTWVAREVLPRLAVTSKVDSIVIHPTCSTVHLACVDDMVACARAVSDDVVVPVDAGCCAFAGDRGLLHPELTAAATRLEAAEVAQREYAEYVSANRTCELGMTRATGHAYRHVLEVLAEHCT